MKPIPSPLGRILPQRPVDGAVVDVQPNEDFAAVSDILAREGIPFVGLAGAPIDESEYGTSPHAWRMQARANAAAKCLRDKVALSEAAGSCGFFDQAHMSRVFKKVFGVTPGQCSHMH
jgi:hypothetical protein